MNRIRVEWSGVPGGGLSTFYLQGTPTDLSDLTTFYTALKDIVPAGVGFKIPNSGDTLESTTGALTGGWSATGGGTINGTGSGTWASLCGMYVRWNTLGVINGRRLRGRTFIVPIVSGNYDAVGTINNTTVSTVETAANALVTALPGMGIWHRPSAGGSDGQIVGWESATVPDRVTTLRTRRD